MKLVPDFEPKLVPTHVYMYMYLVLQYFSDCPFPKFYQKAYFSVVFFLSCFSNSPFVHTMQVAVTSIVIFVILPLTLVGTVLGRNLNGAPNVPCRVNTVPRPIPEKKW